MSKNRERTIVGLDPGSTSAVAIVDLRGNLKKLESEKHMGQKKVISTIVEEGKPVLIATDKGKLPSTIEDISSNFSAETFVPEEDLSIKRKKELAGEYDFENLHERDALSAAINAYNTFKNKFRNIESRMDELNLQDVSPEIKELVVTGRAKNVSEAVEKVLGRDKDDEEEEKRVDSENISQEDFNEKIDNYRQIIMQERKDKEKLEKHNEKLKEEMEELEERVSELENEKRELESGARNEVMEKEEINKLKRNLRSKENRIRTLENEKNSLREKLKKIEAFEELRKEGKAPVREIKSMTTANLKRKDRKLSLKNSIILTREIEGNIEDLTEVIKDLGIEAIIGDFSKEKEDELISEDILASRRDSIEIKERQGVKYIEGGDIKDIKGEEKESFIDWLKGYRDRDD